MSKEKQTSEQAETGNDTLGVVSHRLFRCSKCGLEVKSEKFPPDFLCRQYLNNPCNMYWMNEIKKRWLTTIG